MSYKNYGKLELGHINNYLPEIPYQPDTDKITSRDRDVSKLPNDALFYLDLTGN